jgi:ferredoxin
MTSSQAAPTAHAGTPSTVTITCLDAAGTEIARLEVRRGTILMRALESVRFVAAPCGGNGACGGCAVELDDGRVVQSCFIRVERDLTVRRRSYR